jgi:hypothetical protein
MQTRIASPLVYALRDAPWQVFGTFTFKNPIPVNREAEVLVRNTMRKACRMAHVHCESGWFLTRGELGELNGRFHFHMLIGNFPPLASTAGFCLDLKNYWSRLRLDVGSFAGVQGDICQVWPYEPSLDGVGYVMKGVERYEYVGEARAYELTKFGLTDRITLSTALLSHVSREIRKGSSETVKTLKQGEHFGPVMMADASQRSTCRTLSQTWATQ